MREQIQRVGPATLTRFAETVHAGLSEMRGATAPRLLLEVMCARMLLPSASDTESAVLQRLERWNKVFRLPESRLLLARQQRRHPPCRRSNRRLLPSSNGPLNARPSLRHGRNQPRLLQLRRRRLWRLLSSNLR